MDTDHTHTVAGIKLAAAAAAAAAAVIVGSMVLIGWAFDITVLKSILPGWFPMKPNAAVGFILTGGALWLTARQSALHTPHSALLFSRLARFFSLLAGLIGVLTLSEYMFGWNLGIDQWLFREPAGAVGTSHPGRMAQEAALNFVLLSVALWIINASRQTRWTVLASASLGLLVTTLALASILSHLTPALGAYGWFGLSVMALHAAMTFMILGVAVMAISWQPEVLPWSLSRRTTAAFACGMVVLVFIGFNASRSQFRMKEMNRQIAYSEAVMSEMANLLVEVIDNQADTRGYVITGAEQFKAHYLEAQAASNVKLDALRKLVADNPHQQQQLARIEASVNAELQWFQQFMDASRTGMTDAARNQIVVHGEELLHNARSTFDQIESEHRQFVERLKREAESVSRLSYLIIFIGTFAGLLIFLIVTFRLNFAVNERVRAEDVLRDSEQQYRTMIENSNDMIWILTADGRFTFINQQAADVAGRRIEDWLGKTFEPLVFEDDLPMILEIHGKVMSGEKTHYEVRVKKTDGGILTLSVNASPIFKDGKVSGTISFASDITERKHHEELLRVQFAETQRARLEWQAVFDSISQPIFLHDSEFRITRANLAYAKAAGMGVSDVIGQPYWKIFPRGEGPLTSCRQSLHSHNEESEEFSTDGEIYFLRSFPAEHFFGEQYSVHILENITGRKQAEAKLLATQTELQGMLTTANQSRQLMLGMIEDQMQSEQKKLEADILRKDALEDAIGAIAATLEQRDPYTAGHQRRVAQLAAAIGEEMGLAREVIEGIHFGGLIHDIGKISVPAEILGKPGRLTDIELGLVKAHAEAGYEIVKEIAFPWPVADMVHQHHERLDGSGYPQALKGEQIVLEARILAVADVVEAMSANRPYRPGFGIEASLDEITRARGTQLDPVAVDACLRIIKVKGFVFTK